MIIIKKTPQSITFHKGDSSLTVRKAKDGIEFHQRVDSREVKDALKTQQLIVILINKESTKTNYQKRFSKLSTLLSGLDKVESFKTLKNRLENIATN